MEAVSCQRAASSYEGFPTKNESWIFKSHLVFKLVTACFAES